MNRNDSFIRRAVLTLLLAAACRLDAGEPATFTLAPEAKVDSTGIFLNQLMGSSSATFPHLRLAPAPSVGQTTSLSRQQIIALAKSAAPWLDTTNWSGPDHVCVSRRTRSLEEAELTGLLRAVLQRDYVADRGELEIHLSRPWAAGTVPDEALSLQITELPAAGMMPTVVAGFEIWCGTERVGTWQLALQAHVWRDLPVAHSQLSRGQLLRDADIVMERRDVLVQREPCVQFPVADGQLELGSSVAVGTPVWSRDVRARSLVHRGQLVEAVFQDGPLTISLKVETLEDGALGQMVRVRNPKTRRELSGKVQNEDLILIAL
jgi:flagella basal body P-ring formation protein FlgA